MLGSFLTLLGVLVSSSLPIAEEVQKVSKISLADLVIEQLQQSATSKDVERRLGKPTGREAVPEVPQAPGGYSWNYRDLQFTFDQHGKRLMAVLTGSSRVTARRLRVGQSTKRALQLYGRPFDQNDDYMVWEVAEDPDETLGMMILLSKGFVTKIQLGEVIEY